MSFASKQAGFFGSKRSTEVGRDTGPTNSGHTIPQDGNLVSGQEYILGSIPVSAGIYGIFATFDILGDATTHFSSILLRVGTGPSTQGTISDISLAINTTLPDFEVYSFTYNTYVTVGTANVIPAEDLSPIFATILPIFVGTQPYCPSYYIRCFKLV